MTKTTKPAPTPSDAVGERVREIRRRRSLTVAELAAACAEAGHPELTTQTLYNIESGRRDKQGRRRRTVSIDELLALAEVLDVPIAVLLWPILEPVGQESTLVFASPQERADFVQQVNKLLAQVHGVDAEQYGMKPADQERSE